MKKNITKLTKYAKKMTGYKKESVNEALKIDIDKLLQNPTVRKLMSRLGVVKLQQQQGALKIINYFANNPSHLGAFKKLSFESVNEVEKWKTIGIDVRDIYDYMVSLKKTNPSKFKKDMKNKALKGIWNRYAKGGEMYKESDLGLTLQKGKTITVTHKKSGKEIVIIDKPNVRKAYEKIGFYAESVNESRANVKKAIAISKKMSGNMTNAVKKIEKIQKGLSKQIEVEDALRKANESVNEGDKKKYWDLYMKWYKTYEAFARETMNLAKSATKIGTTGKTDERIILKNFKKQVIPFVGLMSSWSKGHEKNPHISESDLGLTYKRGKTVKVKHKTSGKSLIIIDKPNVRKEYEKIGFYAESVNEISGVDLAKKVLKNKSYEKGIDLQTANLIVTIDKAYDKNPALQKKFRAIPLQKMKQLVMKYYG